MLRGRGHCDATTTLAGHWCPDGVIQCEARALAAALLAAIAAAEQPPEEDDDA